MLPTSSKRSVLFVCLGNVCRSPAAEGVMHHVVEHRGLGHQVFVDSAGTISYHAGEGADRRMRAAALRRGYDLTSRSRPITVDDAERFDLILAMDRSNHADILDHLDGRPANVRLFSEFLDDGPIDVPDPYYGGEQGFEQVLDLIEQACPRILDHLVDRDP